MKSSADAMERSSDMMGCSAKTPSALLEVLEHLLPAHVNDTTRNAISAARAMIRAQIGKLRWRLVKEYTSHNGTYDTSGL